MQELKLIKPVVVCATLADMPQGHYRMAIELLEGNKVLNNNEAFPISEVDNNSIYCSEAVIEYRKSLGLPDISIRSIPIMSVYGAIDDPKDFLDFNGLLSEVINCNQRFQTLLKVSAPVKVLVKEYVRLQVRIEKLLDINWNRKEKDSEPYEFFSLKDITIKNGYGFKQE